MNVHHVGIACKDVRKKRDEILLLHKKAKASKIFFDKNQDVEICLIKVCNGPLLEIVAGEKVNNYIKKNISYYHLCYEVSDIDNKIDEMKLNGAKLISKPKPAIAFNNRKVAFMYTCYGIIELLEKEI